MTMTIDTIPNARLHLGQPTTVPDGTWFAIAVWDTKQRDYIDSPSLGLHSRSTPEMERAASPVGHRVIRYTVWQGFVTTRRGLH